MENEKLVEIERILEEIRKKEFELYEKKRAYFDENFKKTYEGRFFKTRKVKRHPATKEELSLIVPLYQRNAGLVFCRVYKCVSDAMRHEYSIFIRNLDVDTIDISKMKEISEKDAEKLKKKLIGGAYEV